jgi:hypothetical protein
VSYPQDFGNPKVVQLSSTGYSQVIHRVTHRRTRGQVVDSKHVFEVIHRKGPTPTIYY